MGRRVHRGLKSKIGIQCEDVRPQCVIFFMSQCVHMSRYTEYYIDVRRRT